jgi:hypothetical protein
MMRTFGLVGMATLILLVAGSHEFLLAKHKGKHGGPPCGDLKPVCADGERYSRRICLCVPRDAHKQLVCHVEVDETTGELAGTVINVSDESAHLRVDKHPNDCVITDGDVGTPCNCGNG